MKIIVARRYAHMISDFEKVFEDRTDVEVSADRRSGDRRTRNQPVFFNRRRIERRMRRDSLAEVVYCE